MYILSARKRRAAGVSVAPTQRPARARAHPAADAPAIITKKQIKNKDKRQRMKVLCLLFWKERVDFFVLIADGCAAVCRFTPYSSTASGPPSLTREGFCKPSFSATDGCAAVTDATLDRRGRRSLRLVKIADGCIAMRRFTPYSSVDQLRVAP